VVRTQDLVWFVASAGEIAVLRWPEQSEERERLARLGQPRLLVLEGDTPSPQIDSCVEDWIRLPVPDSDVRARLETLRLHAQRHPLCPVVESWGQVSYDGRSEILSPIEHAITEALVARFGSAVYEQQLLTHGWPDGDGTPTALRVHVYRLRKRLAPLGLTITTLRGRGYIMTPTVRNSSVESDASS
jgi:hypothetical protein